MNNAQAQSQTLYEVVLSDGVPLSRLLSQEEYDICRDVLGEDSIMFVVVHEAQLQA